jgi:hypothetical protein
MKLFSARAEFISRRDQLVLMNSESCPMKDMWMRAEERKRTKIAKAKCN